MDHLPLSPQLRVDAHTHVFCWGENPQEGFLSRKTQQAWLTRLIMQLVGIRSETGETLTEKIRNRLFRQLEASKLDYAIVLAQDAVYRESGTRDDPATHFYVSNDYVLRLAAECPKILPGCSINPIRNDALAELERCHAAGARLIKVHTAIQGVDPSLSRFDPFYRRAKELGIVLMFHTGYEHSCKVVSQNYADPARLARPLDQGGTIIAAHCGTCAFFDPETFYPNFVRMMQQYDNLYGDTAVLASLIRPRAMARLSRENESIRNRIVHGSDYPLLPSRLPFLRRVGMFPPERHNAFDLDLRIKSSFTLGPRYWSRVLGLMGVESPKLPSEPSTVTSP